MPVRTRFATWITRTAGNRRRAVAIVVAGALGPAPFVSERLEWAAQPEDQIAKSFVRKLELQTESWFLEWPDLREPLDLRSPFRMQIWGSEELRVQIEDRYLDPCATQTMRLRRRFDGVSLRTSFDGCDGSEARSPLQSRSVEFECQTGGCRAQAIEGDDVSVRWLEGLREDTDLRGFLPGRAVEPGTAWDIEPDAWIGLYGFAGALPFQHHCRSHGEWIPAQRFAGIRDVPRLRYRGIEDRDGLSCAILQIEGRLRARVERAEPGVTMELFMVGEIPARGEDEIELDLDGELAWDIQKRRTRSLWLQAGIRLVESREAVSGGYSGVRERRVWRGSLACELVVK